MNNESLTPKTDLNSTLGLESPPGKRRRPWRWLAWGGLLLLLALALVKWGLNRDTAEVRYQTVEVRRGDLTVTVSATGNLQPTDQVDVGSEVSGTIATVEVDYNDIVRAGQVLARLDTTKLAAQADQSRAALESARASLLQIQAGLEQSRLELERLARVRQLSGGKVPSGREMDAAEAALKRARADEAAGKAKIAEAEARLQVDQTNLDKAVIVSPINGVVLARSVEPGQTVAASLQAPILFTLAEDLAKMELHVAVDEADVGQVRDGQQATFTVDAYPERTYPARIAQVRYGSQSVEGVVTYLTVLEVDNSDLSLRPGMTATADIVVQEIKDALLVPNAALRFAPPREEKEVESNAGGSLLSKLFPRPSRTRPEKAMSDGPKKQQTVWTLRGNQPVAVPITTGATSGTMTEVISGELTAGMPLIVEAVSKAR
ncbi:MAG: efflux RND transporter periplasmic adaptor subunit [Desulfobulbus sp.]|nr:MAG: efflux RND transporter periplasmic adaptor subunit [Desulfobulbus sp.]